MNSCEFALKGSAATISKFLGKYFLFLLVEFAFYSILYQRSVYPSEDFESVKEFGLFLIKARESRLFNYMKRLIAQIEKWIEIDGIREIVLVVKGQNSGETLERWQFKIDLVKNGNYEKKAAEIEAEIRALMKQISASITFMPLHEEKSKSFLYLC